STHMRPPPPHTPSAPPRSSTPALHDALPISIRERRPIDDLPETARAVVLYVQELLRNNRVETAVFDQLLKAHDPKWMVELTCWIGRYVALCAILNAFEVTPAAPAELLPDLPRPLPRPTPPPPR